MQTKLSFIEDVVSVPQPALWDQLKEEHKQVVIEMLTRLICKMIEGRTSNRECNDDGQQD
ncbi:MAG TPA: hypothetical protein VE994_15300 [Terriglobales bacterium]|nr:hypothetical protein [Terriglobales bacterium]